MKIKEMLSIFLLLMHVSHLFGWNLVKELTTADEVSCEIECHLDSKCSAWTFANQDKMPIHSTKCYLQSQFFIDSKLNVSMLPSGFRGTSGNNTSQLVKHHRLLTGPIAIGRTSILNVPQSFYFGCSYTIMLWSWLWKPAKLPEHEIGFFSARESIPIATKHQALLPSVIFNIVSQPDLMFFSTMINPKGDFEGMWGDVVQFNKWTHIALTFQEDLMTVHINGVPFKKPLTMRKNERYTSHKCPGLLGARTSDELGVRAYELSNNTIFQIGGVPAGNMAGIIQNLDVFNGAALTTQQIRKWMDIHPHSEFPTLDSIYGLSYQDMVSPRSIDDAKENDYAMLSLGYCPASVCGKMCIDGEDLSIEEDESGLDEGAVSVDPSGEYAMHSDHSLDIQPLGDLSLLESDGNVAESSSSATDIKEESSYAASTESEGTAHVDENDITQHTRTQWEKLLQHMRQENFNPDMDDTEFQTLLQEYGIDTDISDDDLIRLWQEGGIDESNNLFDAYGVDGVYGDVYSGGYGAEYGGVESFEQLKEILKMNGMESMYGDDELMDIWNDGVLTGELKIDLPYDDSMGYEEYDYGYSDLVTNKQHQQFTHKQKHQDDTSKVKSTQTSRKKKQKHSEDSKSRSKDSTSESEKGLFYEDHFGNSVPFIDVYTTDEGESLSIDSGQMVQSDKKHTDEKVASLTDETPLVDDDVKKAQSVESPPDHSIPHRPVNKPDRSPSPVPEPLPPREFKALLELQLRDPFFRQTVHSKAIYNVDDYGYESDTTANTTSAKIDKGDEAASWPADSGMFYYLMPLVTWMREIHNSLWKNWWLGNRLSSLVKVVGDMVGVNTSALNLSPGDATTSSNTELDSQIDDAVSTILSKYGSKQLQLGEEGFALLRSQIKEYVTLYADSGIDLLKEIMASNVLIADRDASDPRVDRISYLYDQALMWMTGRHLVYNYDSIASTKIAISSDKEFTSYGAGPDSPHNVTYQDVILAYRESAVEKSQSALMMAMWLTDELEIEYPQLAGGYGFKKSYASMLGQPIRLALGFRHAKDMPTEVNVKEDVTYYVDRILGRSADKLALGVAEGEGDELGSVPFDNEGKWTGTRDANDNADGSVPTGDVNWLSMIAKVDSELLSDRLLSLSVLRTLIDSSSATESSDSEASTSPHTATFHSQAHTSVEGDMATDSTISNAPSPQVTSSFANLNQGECSVAASYYLPVANYVNAYFGMVETGVNTPQNIRLADIPSLENMLGGASSVSGTGDTSEAERQMASSAADNTGSLRQYYQAEAAAGNVDAQLWMGIQSYWGTQGFPANATLARKYFEKAAAKNSSEALYCLGAMYDNGQGGLPRNRTKAIELFKLSAAQKVPWPAALQTLGTYYMSSSVLGEQNQTLAKEYFEKAAEMGSPSGYNSLADMYLSGTTGVHQNIPLAVYLYSLSASQGNVRAISILSRALFDSESWLGTYYRQQAMFEIEKTRDGIHGFSLSKAADIIGPIDLDGSSSNPLHTSTETMKPDYISDTKDTEDSDTEEAEDELIRWGYNHSLGITVVIASTGLVVKLPNPLRPDCNVALPLLKYLAEYSYRPNDLMKEALELYLDNDIWGALELYEEAADLGVQAGQENAAFLYDIITKEKCTYQHDRAGLWGKLRSGVREVGARIPFVSALFGIKGHLVSDSYSTMDSDEMNSLSYRGYSSIVHSKHCQAYFRDMATRRWIQVANGGDVDAIREVAKMYQGIGSHTTHRGRSGHLIRNVTKAALLYGAAAANYGDISSVMALALMVQRGTAGVSKNLTLANMMYQRASELENVYSSYGMSWATTMGIAPRLASTYITLEKWVDMLLQYYKAHVEGGIAGYVSMFDTEGSAGVSSYYYTALLLVLGVILFYIWAVM